MSDYADLVKRLRRAWDTGDLTTHDPITDEKWRVWLSRRLLLHSKLRPDQTPDVTPNPAGHSATDAERDQ
jgi:hypothetical protein